MVRNIYLSNRLREVFLEGQWIANTNYKDQLLNTTWEQATRKIDNLNSIAALTFHINYYLSGLLNVLEGGELEISDRYSSIMPVIDSDDSWKKLVNEFLLNSEKFILHVGLIEESKFDDSFVDDKYGSYLRNIEGVIEHGYYHLGQIVIIKKLIQVEY